ncbi:putative secreted protein (Por secretion system target) [Algoriphagus boseongensis]|uniref:Putative secreted protein (Por secretion system target) n=1 Tax=Algoriphagus boseongensis TaxID=1442587 RepID=A0A4R6T7H7_9BACT|nr:M43 family zinc metalloprotease [Algoriphagus boseongensis]TDQ18621.1 putative secreted protein (Por secretion system target) [Algoriphagus boseongensis]
MTPIAFSQKIELKAFDSSFVSSSSKSHSHSEKCGHTVLESMLEKEMGFFGSKDFFENWIDKKIEEKRNAPQFLRTLEEEVRKIPVVVHVIHNGTPIGSGTNIPDSQILDQIRILNEDFRRLNADANRTPAEFLPVAADSKIEFVLAKQDPNGLPTTGIVRIQGPKLTYAPEDATLIGQVSQWNPSEYMNIWVVPLVSPYIGYASFPVSDLPGLNFSPVPAITDGVTIDYRFFGSIGNAIAASKGRTATHEVGHYFGLRHIWGDGGCGVDDFVADTPEQDNSNTICNANPSRFSCGSQDMIQNYMDYTPDACMNIFTKGQVDRFNVVLANSPRRVTLVNNRATQEPQLQDRDLAIVRIIEPSTAICDLTFSPSIEVGNAGKLNITSARIELIRNGSLVESKLVSTNLKTGEAATVVFQPITVPATGSNEFTFTITQVNGLPDQNGENNTRTSRPIIQGEIQLPYTYNLSAFPGDWIVQNSDQSFTWEKTNITVSGQAQEAIFVRNYEYNGPGALDLFYSPAIDLTKYPNAQLVFEVAHAPYDQSGFQDQLIVAVSQDCGQNFDIAGAKYNKSGTRLQTSNPTLDEFIPVNSNQFRLELVNLSKYKDLGKIRVAFINNNAYGNNIYIRNIRILPTEEFKYEVGITRLVAPEPINSGDHQEEEIALKNTGNLPVTGFFFTRTTNSGAAQTFVASGTTLNPGDEITVGLNNSTADGNNRLAYRLSEPNFDQNADSYPTFTRYIVESNRRTEVPWRQNFNSSTDLTPWTTVNTESNGVSWTINPVSTGSGPNNVARLSTGVDGNSYWLGTPIFDLSLSSQASIFFDIAAGQVNPQTKLRVLASTNGGTTYTQIWSATGAELSTVTVGEANPSAPGDYRRKYVNLTEFAGSGKNNIRLAFVLEVKGSGNSPVYLDNLELFLSANPDPVIPGEGSTVLFPNPTSGNFNLAFNLPRRENVRIQIISSTGAIMQDVLYDGTLNQTYTFSRELFAPGLYILKINSETLQELKRLIIN